jgi:hypothetical protein
MEKVRKEPGTRLISPGYILSDLIPTTGLPMSSRKLLCLLESEIFLGKGIKIICLGRKNIEKRHSSRENRIKQS